MIPPAAPSSRSIIAEPGSSVAVENLIKGMIIQSGNDSSIALAERIVSRHGGTISAFGELDRGARFSVSIPEAGGEA